MSNNSRDSTVYAMYLSSVEGSCLQPGLKAAERLQVGIQWCTPHMCEMSHRTDVQNMFCGHTVANKEMPTLDFRTRIENRMRYVSCLQEGDILHFVKATRRPGTHVLPSFYNVDLM